MAISETWLVGDIGGTNARFGLMSPQRELLHSSVLADSDYPEIGDAIEAYLAMRGEVPQPRVGAIALASPITGDRVRMTNHSWSFSIEELRKRIGLDRLLVINDFTARRLRCRLSAAASAMTGGARPAKC